MTTQLTAAEAARRLGVKPATLYAYVSRGTPGRQRSADGRTSLFDAEEIERLARRGRPRRPAGALDITVESRITQISGDRLRYRGRDATRLARMRPFEDVADLLRRGERIPGFGHSAYRGEDPRFTVLMGLVRAAAPKSRAIAVTDGVIAEVRRKSLPEPNIDLALGALAVAAGMTRGAGEAVFAVARTAGWLAHAMEAYETGKILRPRASYVGPAADIG